MLTLLFCRTKKTFFDFAKEIFLDESALGIKSTTDESFLRLLKSPAIIALGISAIISAINPNELSAMLKLLLQENEAGKKSDRTNEEIVATADKLLEDSCISINIIYFYYLKV